MILFVSSTINDGNMSLNYGDPKEALKNRLKFFKKFGIKPEQVIEANQVHGNKIHVYAHGPTLKQNLKADGIITNILGIYLMVKVADCHQIGFYDPDHQAVGLIHAGWKGLDKGIIKNAISTFVTRLGSDPRHLMVQFGSSIGPCCYRMDIWKQAENQLTDLGIPKSNIDNPQICTYHTGNYYSHRRAVDKNEPDFRFITIMGIKI